MQLGINPHTLRGRMKKFGIDWRRFRHADPAGATPIDSLLPLEVAMRLHVERALRLTGGRVEGPGGAARKLAVNPHTLRGRMRKLGVKTNEFRIARERRIRS